MTRSDVYLVFDTSNAGCNRRRNRNTSMAVLMVVRTILVAGLDVIDR